MYDAFVDPMFAISLSYIDVILLQPSWSPSPYSSSGPSSAMFSELEVWECFVTISIIKTGTMTLHFYRMCFSALSIAKEVCLSWVSFEDYTYLHVQTVFRLLLGIILV